MTGTGASVPRRGRWRRERGITTRDKRDKGGECVAPLLADVLGGQFAGQPPALERTDRTIQQPRRIARPDRAPDRYRDTVLGALVQQIVDSRHGFTGTGAGAGSPRMTAAAQGRQIGARSVSRALTRWPGASVIPQRPQLVAGSDTGMVVIVIGSPSCTSARVYERTGDALVARLLRVGLRGDLVALVCGERLPYLFDVQPGQSRNVVGALPGRREPGDGGALLGSGE